MTLVCSLSLCTYARAQTRVYVCERVYTETSGFRSRRAVLVSALSFSCRRRLRRRLLRLRIRRWANTHGSAQGRHGEFSAVPALISGKPPQIRPANSALLSLIVAKEDGDGNAKENARLLLIPPLGSFSAEQSCRSLPPDVPFLQTQLFICTDIIALYLCKYKNIRNYYYYE